MFLYVSKIVFIRINKFINVFFC